MSARFNEKLKNNLSLIPVILMSIVIFSILSSFGLKMINEAKDSVVLDYISEVKNISTLYEKEIYAIEKTSQILVEELAEEEADILEDEAMEIAKIYASSIGVKNVILVDPSYYAKDIKGKEYNHINKTNQFQGLFDKKEDTNLFLANETGDSNLYIISPVTTSTTFKGYIIIEYVPRVIETLLSNPKYSSMKTYALVSNTGEVVEIAGNDSKFMYEGANILENAQSMIFVGKGSYNAFRQTISDCRTGSQQIIYKEEGTYVFFTPIAGTKAIAMMLVDTDDVEKSNAAVSKTIRSMLLEIGITVAAFFLLFLIFSMFNRAKFNLESEDLQTKADTDLLTDLYNKMATERLIKEYLEGEGKNSMSMLFLLDVDDFKKINDTKGHAFGDQVLAQLGHQIRAWFRVSDIIGRIGGDEFMIFVKDVKDPEAIKREGSRIMQFFDGFNVGEYAKYSPTASVGGAVFPNDANDFESLYKAADKAVYKSKKEGKNRVSFYSDLNNSEKVVDTGK